METEILQSTVPTPTPVAPATPTPEQAPRPGGQGRFGGGQRGGRGSGFGRGVGFGGRGRRPGGRGGFATKSEYDQKVLDIARVSRVTKGGKRFSFRATIVIGDGKGKVGVGLAKGKDVAQSVQKAFNQAKKNLVTVLIKDGTIPYQVEAKYNSAVVLLKPARGGVKAGGPVRVVAKLSGSTRLTGKLLRRTNNKVNIAMATIEALKKLRVKEKISDNGK